MGKSGILDVMFGRYGASININAQPQNIEIYGVSNRYPSSYGYTKVEVKIDFPSKETVIEFANDLTYVQSLREEEKLRASNPTLQNAWEEYQLLLKLSK